MERVGIGDPRLEGAELASSFVVVPPGFDRDNGLSVHGLILKPIIARTSGWQRRQSNLKGLVNCFFEDGPAESSISD